jgi:hypothetical protein
MSIPWLPSLHGSLIRPEDPQYDEARTLYNAMIDKRPALIARCADVQDVLPPSTSAGRTGSASPSAAADTTAPVSAASTTGS